MANILFITPNPIDSASERYRIYQFLPYFERAGFACTVRPFVTRKLFRAIQAERLAPKLFLTPFCITRRLLDLLLTPGFDAVVIHREAFPFLSPAVERMFLRRHRRVIFSFDDAIHVGHQDTPNQKYSWMYRLKYGSGVNEVMRASVHVIAGSDALAKHALQFNQKVSVVPTVVDLNRYPYEEPRVKVEPITIGWVGSRSTSPYLLEVVSALRKLSEAHPGKVRFRLWGHPSRRLDLPDFESLPFSLNSEIQDLRSIDIGIMPMPDTSWTRGKCSFKAIQYMACGIPTVVSPVGMATKVVTHGMNGFWARNEEEWFVYLDQLVRDENLRRRFSEAGRQTVEQEYSLQTWGPRLTALFDEILAEPRRIAETMPSLQAES
jgi:glycosyltransferase involved in cell wall biosynthesis